jgi:hypothetical protein
MSFTTALKIGIVPLALVGFLASRWRLQSTRWHIIAISTLSGLLTGGAVGNLVHLGRPPIGLAKAPQELPAIAAALAIAFGLIGAILGVLLGLSGAAATARERRLDPEARADFKRFESRYSIPLFIAVSLSAAAFYVARFGQPPQFRPVPLVLGILLGYTLFANFRGAALTLSIVAMSLFSDAFESGPSGGSEFRGWTALWQTIQPQLGWFVSGAVVAGFITSSLLSRMRTSIGWADAEDPIEARLRESRSAASTANAGGDAAGEATHLNDVGNGLYFKGAYREAQGWHERALVIWRRLAADGEPGVVVPLIRALRWLADSYKQDRQLERAVGLYREAILIGQQLADPREVAACHFNWGTLEDTRGNLQEAAQCLTLACSLFEAAKANGLSRAQDRPNAGSIDDVLARARGHLSRIQAKLAGTR